MNYYYFANYYVKAGLEDIAVHEARQVDRLIEPKEDYVKLCNESALRAIEERAEEICEDFIAEPGYESEDFTWSEKGARDACMSLEYTFEKGFYDSFFESLWDSCHDFKDILSSICGAINHYK